MSVLNKSKVEKEIEELGLTKKDVAKKMEMSEQSFSRMISEKTDNPRLDNVLELSKILNVSIDYLLDLTDEKEVNIEVKEMSNKLGISIKAIQNLLWIKNNVEYGAFPIDDLLASPCIYSINSIFKDLYEVNSLNEYGQYDVVFNSKTKESIKKINQFNMIDVYIYELMTQIRRALDYSDSKRKGIEETIKYIESLSNGDEYIDFKDEIPDLKEKLRDFERNKISCEVADRYTYEWR